MPSHTQMRPRTTSTASEFALSRQAQALALAEADLAREEKRRLMAACINPHAGKWRYPAT